MPKQEEEARIAAAVQAQLEKIVTVQQQQFAQTFEKTMKEALKGVDKANAALAKERKAVEKELDAAQKARAKAERESEKMVQAYFEDKQKQFVEAARTELLRELAWMHLEVGKLHRDIASWLDVPIAFVENISQVVQRNASYNPPMRLHLEGGPRLRYSDMGRGGTIYFESASANFDMWWEFAIGDAVVIVDIPTEEKWEARTKIPIERRMHTLTFIGEQILHDKISSGGSFIIGDNVLTFYAGGR